MRNGKVFALNTPIDVPGPAMFHRHDTRHEPLRDTGNSLAATRLAPTTKINYKSTTTTQAA